MYETYPSYDNRSPKPRIHLKDINKVFPPQRGSISHTVKDLIMDMDKNFIHSPKTLLMRKQRNHWHKYLFTPKYLKDNSNYTYSYIEDPHSVKTEDSLE